MLGKKNAQEMRKRIVALPPKSVSKPRFLTAMAKIKIYYDIRWSKSDATKEAPLMLAVTHRSRTAYIPLQISVIPAHWDSKGGKVVKHPQRRMYNDIITKRLVESERAYILLCEQGKITVEMSATQIRDAIIEFQTPLEVKVAKEQETTLEKVFERYISHKKGSTKRLYEGTLRRIKEFSGDKFGKLRFEDINKEWLQQWDDFMSEKAPSVNSRGINLRNLRAVFNDAIDNEITTNYPFRRFKIKTAPTRKRNLKIDALRRVFQADHLEPWMEKYRDFFMLSFMLCGINVVDMCNLKEVKDGRVEYIRAKTHKTYSIKVESEALAIIDRYRGDKHLLNYLDTYNNYRHFYNNLCKGLRGIKELCGLEELTTYWARHSWATIASSLDIPKDTIAAALGHGNRTVTDVYIEYDMRKVDVANRKVLDWVLYGKKQRVI